MEKYTFDCGCVIDGTIDFRNINLDCKPTWEMMCKGDVKGVFQLEGSGMQWAPKLKPENITELSALAAVIRPGTLDNIVDDKSLTQHFCDRKHGLEKVEYLDPHLEPILRDTYGILVYQEQAIRIASDIAGFSLSEADLLRKAAGKKQPELMASLESDFVEKATKVGKVSTETAKEIFEQIRASQRYAFNLSHSISYSFIAYWTAYAKYHFPLQFYTSYLYYASDKPHPKEEIADLVEDARNHDLIIRPPSMDALEVGNFGKFSISNGGINFGLLDVKDIGDAKLQDFHQLFTLHKDVIKDNWFKFLTIVCSQLSSKVVNGLIMSGTLDHYHISRNKMVFEYNIWRQINDKEKEMLKNQEFDSLHDVLQFLNSQELHARRKGKMQDLLNIYENPPYSLDDDIQTIVETECELLGVSLTYNALDGCELITADTTCQEFLDGKNGNMNLSVEIIRIMPYKIKRGKSQGKIMAFVDVKDQTAKINCVAFPDDYKKFKTLLRLGNTVNITGKRSDRNSLIINNLCQI